MLIRVDKASDEPLYLQICTQIIAAIAREALVPGETLPSVRSLAGDLGVNLHTVNKAYAVLRDEGYITMRGRSSAVVSDPADNRNAHKTEAAAQLMEEVLYELALAHRARGGRAEDYLSAANNATTRAYERDS